MRKNGKALERMWLGIFPVLIQYSCGGVKKFVPQLRALEYDQ